MQGREILKELQNLILDVVLFFTKIYQYAIIKFKINLSFDCWIAPFITGIYLSFGFFHNNSMTLTSGNNVQFNDNGIEPLFPVPFFVTVLWQLIREKHYFSKMFAKIAHF